MTDYSAIQHKITERMRKLEMLQHVVADPEALELLRELLGSGNGSSSPKLDFTGGYGSLLESVLATTNSIDGTFTVQLVEKMMRDHGYVFAATNSKIAVGQVLRKLAMRKQITLVKEGTGQAPHVYERLRPNK